MANTGGSGGGGCDVPLPMWQTSARGARGDFAQRQALCVGRGCPAAGAIPSFALGAGQITRPLARWLLPDVNRDMHLATPLAQCDDAQPLR